jgi:hypothetical protein
MKIAPLADVKDRLSAYARRALSDQRTVLGAGTAQADAPRDSTEVPAIGEGGSTVSPQVRNATIRPLAPADRRAIQIRS